MSGFLDYYLIFKSDIMKKIFYMLFIPLLILSGSCKKFLDQQPISSLSEAKFWKTAADAPLGMAGIYDGVQGVSKNLIEYGDARSDNMMAGGSGSTQFQVALNAMTPTIAFCNWATFYTVISRVNVAIKNLPDITGLTDLNRNHYLAQCYALRALMYFYMIRLWGDVPVWTEPFELGTPADLVRTPVSEVMSKVILPDILKAETLANPTGNNLYEINIGSIYAIEQDVYMWNKDYVKANAAADKLIALNRYALAPKDSWKQIFTVAGVGTTKENIFNIAYDYLKDGRENNTVLIGVSGADAMYQIDNTTSQESPIQLRFQAQRAQGDIRAELTYDTRLNANNSRKIGKYFDWTAPYPQTTQFQYPLLGDANTKWPIYRYADIILLKAEALNQIGGATNRAAALAIVNQIRARAGLTTPLVLTNFPTTKDLETCILDERQTELFAEGKRWFDLVRVGRLLEYMDPEIRKREVRSGVVPQGFTDPRKILLPIGRAALIANKSLKQNPPWSE
jgi:hypothetical protein